MSFDTANGTRGARQPGGMFLRWMNRAVMRRISRGGSLMGGTKGLVLNTVGRKSGAERKTPLVWFPDPGGGWLIVASAAGAARNPAWYYNLAARPDEVTIDVGGRRIPVRARQLHGEERDRAWRDIAGGSSRFRKYQQQTDRELPIIHHRTIRRRLTHASQPPAPAVAGRPD